MGETEGPSPEEIGIKDTGKKEKSAREKALEEEIRQEKDWAGLASLMNVFARDGKEYEITDEDKLNMTKTLNALLEQDKRLPSAVSLYINLCALGLKEETRGKLNEEEIERLEQGVKTRLANEELSRRARRQEGLPEKLQEFTLETEGPSQEERGEKGKEGKKEIELKPGDKVRLTLEKINELEKAGMMHDFPTTEGEVSGVFGDRIAVNFGGSTRNISPNEVEKTRAEGNW